MIHLFVALMHAGAPARLLVDAQLVHPTLAEGLQSLLLGVPRFALSPPRRMEADLEATAD